MRVVNQGGNAMTARFYYGKSKEMFGTVGFYLKYFLFALWENSSRLPPLPPLFSSS